MPHEQRAAFRDSDFYPMIGHLVDAYVRGRDDAKSGRERAAWAKCPYQLRVVYELGYNDERRRMREEKRLGQLRLDLGIESPAPGMLRRWRGRGRETGATHPLSNGVDGPLSERS